MAPGERAEEALELEVESKEVLKPAPTPPPTPPATPPPTPGYANTPREEVEDADKDMAADALGDLVIWVRRRDI